MDALRLSRQAYQIAERGIRALEQIGRELKRRNDRAEADGVTVDPAPLATVVEFVRDDPALDHAPEDSPVPPAIERLQAALDNEENTR